MLCMKTETFPMQNKQDHELIQCLASSLARSGEDAHALAAYSASILLAGRLAAAHAGQAAAHLFVDAHYLDVT